MGAACIGQFENYFNSSLFHIFAHKNSGKYTRVYKGVRHNHRERKEKMSQGSSTFPLVTRER